MRRKQIEEITNKIKSGKNKRKILNDDHWEILQKSKEFFNVKMSKRIFVTFRNQNIEEILFVVDIEEEFRRKFCQ